MSVLTPLVEVLDAKKYYPVLRFGGLGGKIGDVKAVDGVSFSVGQGETFGLVGESGSGKTTMAKLLLRLEPLTGGEIRFEGLNLARLPSDKRNRVQTAIQAVFQDPYSSLSPRMRVRDIVSEPIVVNGLLPRRQTAGRVAAVLDMVGLPPGSEGRFPHEFSGGQRQRIAVARALAINPRLIVLDEPVSALDVSIRAQILNLLKDLQNQLGLTYLLIVHDLAVVEHMADRIGVMYLGKLVEQAASEELYRQPLHPYTQALLAAAPEPDPTRRREFTALTGEIASALNPPLGCRFHPRCPYATDRCSTEEPHLREIVPGHAVACHHAERWFAPADEVTDKPADLVGSGDPEGRGKS